MPAWCQRANAHTRLPFFERVRIALAGLARSEPEGDDITTLAAAPAAAAARAPAARRPPAGGARDRRAGDRRGAGRVVTAGPGATS